MSKRLIVVGGGLAGLGATIRAAEKGITETLVFSVVPVKRSHSVCAQGGINGAVNTKGEGDSTWEHFDDTIYGGDFLANQTPVKGMCEAAPGILHLYERMGVTFNRTPEGLMDFRRFGGTKHRRTAFAGATTGQQLMYALDEQVRRLEVTGQVKKYEGWEFLSLVLDDNGVCVGIVAQDLETMKVEVFKGDAVIIATGGLGAIYGKSTNSTINTGCAASIVYQQGAYYANGEFIQFHPTAVPGDDKLRLMSESARGEGGRVWTYKDGEPWYFLEEMFPAYGNLVPRDIATRAIFNVVFKMGLGVDGENKVYLDLSHIDSKILDRKLGGILEIYEKFTGDDPRKVPMKIFPAMHYTMGGVWSDYDHMTNIPGLFSAGESDYQYHGANRLGANSLLSATYAGLVAGPAAAKFILGKESKEVPEAVYTSALKKQQDLLDNLYKMSGKENPFSLHEELGQTMSANVSVERFNKNLKIADEKIQELMERYKNINVHDKSKWANQVVQFSRQLWDMMVLARVITLGALNRDESRGAHYKPDFPERDDEKWLKTTMAKYSSDGPIFSYDEVDLSFIKPRKRAYDVDKGGK